MKKIRLLLLILAALFFYSFKLELFVMKINAYELGEETETKLRVIQVSDIQISEKKLCSM